jgi:opacity protein-like surface antigen
MIKRLKYSLMISLILMSAFVKQGFANTKFSLSAGGYSVSGTGGTKPVSVSGFGSYRLGVMQELRKNISISLGYNIIYESVISGDSIYGLDLGVSWFFLEPALVEVFKADNVSMRITRQWTPYAGIHFNQRQFQSNKSNFSGLGIHGGCQFPIVDNFSWHVEGRYNSLTGPNQATATEMSIFGGVSSDF